MRLKLIKALTLHTVLCLALCISFRAKNVSCGRCGELMMSYQITLLNKQRWASAK